MFGFFWRATFSISSTASVLFTITYRLESSSIFSKSFTSMFWVVGIKPPSSWAFCLMALWWGGNIFSKKDRWNITWVNTPSKPWFWNKKFVLFVDLDKFYDTGWWVFIVFPLCEQMARFEVPWVRFVIQDVRRKVTYLVNKNFTFWLSWGIFQNTTIFEEYISQSITSNSSTPFFQTSKFLLFYG